MAWKKTCPRDKRVAYVESFTRAHASMRPTRINPKRSGPAGVGTSKTTALWPASLVRMASAGSLAAGPSAAAQAFEQLRKGLLALAEHAGIDGGTIAHAECARRRDVLAARDDRYFRKRTPQRFDDSADERPLL